MSHPQALAQCDNYLRRWGVNRQEAYDTAGAAKLIRDNNLLDCAAIASELAASSYGLSILDRNIEDYSSNYTRFLLLSKEPVDDFINSSIEAKTSIVFVLPNASGSLFRALSCFALRDLDCSKVESRPTSVELLSVVNPASISDKMDSDGDKAQDQNTGNSNDFTGGGTNMPSASAGQTLDELPKFRYEDVLTADS
jgi:prephenate dehydratase